MQKKFFFFFLHQKSNQTMDLEKKKFPSDRTENSVLSYKARSHRKSTSFMFSINLVWIQDKIFSGLGGNQGLREIMRCTPHTNKYVSRCESGRQETHARKCMGRGERVEIPFLNLCLFMFFWKLNPTLLSKIAFLEKKIYRYDVILSSFHGKKSVTLKSRIHHDFISMWGYAYENFWYFMTWWSLTKI